MDDDTSSRDEVSTRLHTEEDAIIEKAEACYGRTFVVDVRRLTVNEVPIADNHAAHRNREMDQELVERLVQSFCIAVRRYSMEDRIRVITSQDAMDAIVDLLVDVESLNQNSSHGPVLKEGVISRMRIRTRSKVSICLKYVD